MNDIFKLSKLSWCDGRYVQDLGTNSPFLADKRLLFIPTSCFRVTENNPNWGNFYRFASIFINATYCCYRCNTCVAQPIRAMKTWRHPFFHPIYHRQYSLSTKMQFNWFNWIKHLLQQRKRVSLVTGLNLTSQDTSWRQPCSTCSF